MRVFAILFALALLVACSKASELTPAKAPEASQKEEQYKKEMDEIKKSIKGEVKIKLKKDPKGGYSWEIAGKDAQEVLKANDVLVKKLGQ